MKPFRVVIEPRAHRDIQAQLAWIIEQSHSSAKALRWSRGLKAKIATLRTSPRRCPVDSDSAEYGEEVRVLLHGRRPSIHRVLFAIREDRVHVLTIRHSARHNLSEEIDPAFDE